MKGLVYIAAFLVLAFCPVQAKAGDITAEVRGQLLASAPWQGADVEIDEIQLGAEPPARYDSVRVEAQRGLTIGKVAISAVFASGGRDIKTVWGSARVRVFRDMVVALRALKINHRIAYDDVRLARTEVRDPSEAPGSLEEAVGTVVKRPIAAGAIVRADYIRPEPVIRRGDKVTVNVENQKIRIRSFGTASEDGARGSVISVKTNSGREIRGRVSGPGEVSVGF